MLRRRLRDDDAMTPPRPTAIRLETQARGARPPSPPWGLGIWTPDADAVAVMLDATGVDLDDIAVVAAQLPDPSTIARGAPVAVLANAVHVSEGWRRLLGTRRVPVPRATRCAALLVRGYVDIGASPTATAAGNLTWGFAPGPAL